MNNQQVIRKVIRINALWSQKHGRVGNVVAEEDDEIIVKFGNSIINFRYHRTEVIDMQDAKIVGERPYADFTIADSAQLYKLGIVSEADADRKVVVLRREIPDAA